MAEEKKPLWRTMLETLGHEIDDPDTDRENAISSLMQEPPLDAPLKGTRRTTRD